jgi:two-component system NtrC family sensor kinase
MDLALQYAFLAEGSTLLILLAGAILLYRSFRERYLELWIAGWTAYTVSRFLIGMHAGHSFSVFLLICAFASFIAAMGLFACAVFLYVDQKKLILPAVVTLLISFGLGIPVYFGAAGNLIPPQVVELCWRLVLIAASLQLLRFAWGRLNIGRWLLAVMLVMPHLHHRTGGSTELWHEVLIDLLLGISMMTIVLDDSRVQIQRLDVLNTITSQISESRDFEPTVAVVLEELTQISRAKAAWFRVLEGDKLVLAAHRGLSQAFVTRGGAIDANRSVSGFALREREVYVVRASEAAPELSAMLKEERIHHVLLVPVEGRQHSQIGTFALGVAHFRAHMASEKKFLKAAARQLGLAAENRKLAQQVAQSRNEWASTFDSIPDFILVHDSQYRILRANKALVTRLRRLSDEVFDHTCEDVLPGAGISWVGCPYCAHADCSGEEDPCFGGYSVVSSSKYTADGAEGAVHVIKDITEAKAADERYTSLFNHMHEGVFASTPEGKFVDCNEAFVRMLGYASKEEVLGLEQIQSSYVDQEDRAKFLNEMSRHGFVRNFEYRLRRKDGKEISVIESSFATRDPAGRIERYQGVLMDVTEMKRAEDEIRRRNRELYVLNNIAVTFNQSFDLQEILQLSMLQIVELLSTDTASVYLFEENGNQLLKQAAYGHRSAFVSDSPYFALPVDFVESLRAGHAEILDHESQARLPEIVQKIIEVEELKAWIWVVLWRKEKMMGVLATSSRSPRQFTRSEEGVMIAVGRQLATTIEKIQLYHETRKAYEDLRRTQEQLLQSEKMSAVGQLISGVAHELNNPLTAILGYAQLLESEKLEPRVEEFITKLHKQAQRTQRIVQNLLSFSRQHKPQRVQVDLRSVIEDTIALRDYDLKVNNIIVERDFDPVLPSVVADPHQLEQVYLNIINNAADAMLDGFGRGLLRIHVFSQNGHVVSEFHDSGPGITDTKHVFDPFYTTKGVGKGTGLGLSICYGIVKEHGGEITAHNHSAGGAVLEVRLPAAVGEKPVTESDRIVARRESRLEGHVLLIDDEDALLDLEREVLTAAGLRVVTANTGGSAIDLLQQQDFDAVFLDSKIPGTWSSQDVYRHIEQQQPHLVSKTVLVLSDISDPNVKAFVEATQIFCLVKPFEVADLLSVARRVMKRARAAAHS